MHELQWTIGVEVGATPGDQVGGPKFKNAPHQEFSSWGVGDSFLSTATHYLKGGRSMRRRRGNIITKPGKKKKKGRARKTQKRNPNPSARNRCLNETNPQGHPVCKLGDP